MPRAKRQVRAERPIENPFLSYTENVLPDIPDDPEWSYLWMRTSIDGKDDGKNVVAHMNGRLPYQLVRPEELPSLAPLTVKQGSLGNCIAINDVVLVKIPRELRDMFVEATEINARKLNDQLQQRVRDQISDPDNEDRILPIVQSSERFSEWGDQGRPKGRSVQIDEE